MMRKFHRWFSLPLALFVFLVLGTGVYLQTEEAIGTLSANEAGPQKSEQAAAPLSDQEIQAMLGDALAQARQTAPDFEPKIIQMSLSPAQEKTRFGVQPRGGPFIEVDRNSGEAVAEMNPSMPLHVVFIRLHTGSIAGAAGIWIMMITSLVLAFLSISGIVLYYQMWANRKQRGRGKLFWQ